MKRKIILNLINFDRFFLDDHQQKCELTKTRLNLLTS